MGYPPLYTIDHWPVIVVSVLAGFLVFAVVYTLGLRWIEQSLGVAERTRRKSANDA